MRSKLFSVPSLIKFIQYIFELDLFLGGKLCISDTKCKLFSYTPHVGLINVQILDVGDAAHIR